MQAEGPEVVSADGSKSPKARTATGKPRLNLSPDMRRCVEFMASNGGKLHRHPGGFWWRETPDYGFNSFSTSTVEAIVKRGVARYIEHKQGRTGQFPITAELVPGATA